MLMPRDEAWDCAEAAATTSEAELRLSEEALAESDAVADRESGLDTSGGLTIDTLAPGGTASRCSQAPWPTAAKSRFGARAEAHPWRLAVSSGLGWVGLK